MKRSLTELKGLGLTGVLATGLVFAGIWGHTQEPGRRSTGTLSTPVILTGAETTKPGAAADRPPEPMLKGWQKPKVAIVLSGEQNGYLEPCGCSAKQSGGFARRGDLFRQLQAKQWPVVAFDLGGTLKRSRREDQLKFEEILEGFNIMHYSAMGLGPSELRVGAEKLISLHNPEKGKIAFVSSNVVFFGAPDLGTPLPYKIVDVNGVKVGVTSVLGDFYRNQVLPRNPGANADIDATPALAAVTDALKKMKADPKPPELFVLLSYCSVDESKALLQKVQGFDVAITAGGPEEPIDRTDMIGQTMLISVGGKGKHVAILGYYPDAKPRLKYELVNLDQDRFQNLPAMDRLMVDFQERLADENLSETEKRVPHGSGAGFVGAQKCGECHKKAYAKWKTTKHYMAYDSLINGRPDVKGKWIPRTHDLECLACHVTGWDPQEVIPFETGFVSAEKTPQLKGQQCENCHGPGSEHVKAEEAFKKTRRTTPAEAKWRAKMHMDTALASNPNNLEKSCYKCHDGDNSPKFKFDEFYKQISHKGLRD